MRVSIPYTWDQEMINKALEVHKVDKANSIKDKGDTMMLDQEESWHGRGEYFDMLPEWAKDIPELHYVCQHTRPENIAEEYKHFLAFNGQMNGWKYNENIKAELIEGMFRRLNVTPDQIRKAILDELIEWS